jgi:hypothetical protein
MSTDPELDRLLAAWRVAEVVFEDCSADAQIAENIAEDAFEAYDTYKESLR